MGFKINDMKAVKIPFLISILCNDLLIPFIIFAVVKKGNTYNIQQAVMMLTQMFTPFLGAFCVYMHLAKYIDTKGNEIYFVYRRNKWKEVVSLCVLYTISNSCFFLWYVSLNKKFITEWLHIVIMCVVFCMAAYCFSFAFRSISLAIIPCFLYTMLSISGFNPLFQKISYYEGNVMSMQNLWGKYCYFLLAALVFAAVGNILNKHYCHYNE